MLRIEGGVIFFGFDLFGGWVMCVVQVGLDNCGGVFNFINVLQLFVLFLVMFVLLDLVGFYSCIYLLNLCWCGGGCFFVIDLFFVKFV